MGAHGSEKPGNMKNGFKRRSKRWDLELRMSRNTQRKVVMSRLLRKMRKCQG
jgi:hypothetical protein